MKYILVLVICFSLLGCNPTTTTPTSSPSSEATVSVTPAETPVASATSTPSAATVSFGNLKDGDTVESPVKVVMVVEGMEVKPAGEDAPNSGHHHIVIDGEPLAKGTVVPADDKNIHYGKGQTETEITLEPGEHTLTLQFADYAHRSFGPELSSTVKITVK